MRNAVTQFSRIFVGVLFIISGLIKLNDPVGFSFKLEEYFSEPVLNLPFLMPLALSLAVILVIAEVILGVMLLIGYKRKFTLWSLLAMIVFFTFLTFYSAYFNKVTDCGCFGDALKLTPWESFTKDVVLLVLIVIIMINRDLIRPLFSNKINGIITLVSLILCGFMAYYVLNHLPIKDFRAYKIGTNIPQGMEIPDGAPRAEIEMVFIYNVDGENREFTEADLMDLPEGATFVDRRDKVLSLGYVPPIHDFTMERNGTDYTAELMNEPKLLMFVMYDLSKADQKGLEVLNKLAEDAFAKGYRIAAMTSSTEDQIKAVQQTFGHSFEYFFCDATTLKTIERANPSLVVLKNGTITDKKHWKDAEALQLD